MPLSPSFVAFFRGSGWGKKNPKLPEQGVIVWLFIFNFYKRENKYYLY
jgi:hypothetical protein